MMGSKRGTKATSERKLQLIYRKFDKGSFLVSNPLLCSMTIVASLDSGKEKGRRKRS